MAKKHTTQPKNQQTFAQKVREYTANHKLIVIAISILLIACITVVALALLQTDTPVETPKPVMQKPAPKPATKYYSPLTGLEVADEAATKNVVTAVMIENSPDARPQSGLQQADVVYEAIAEGGITRFVALYQQQQPELIGPVRSLRMYYIDWITPYDPSVAHVGGSKKAKKEIRNGNHKDIDQFFNADAYWRAPDRYAPHNVYTTSEKLAALNSSKGYTAANPKAIPRTDSMPEASMPATQATVIISGPLYNSSWAYDETTKKYLRSQAGEPHQDREKGQITAEVVVVLGMRMDIVQEDGMRGDYHTAGSGNATIFAQGKAIEATWHKQNMESQLHFTDKQTGKDLALPRGTTWFTAVPINSGGSVSWQ